MKGACKKHNIRSANLGETPCGVDVIAETEGQMIRKQPSLKINAISNWTSLIVQVMVGFFLTPFIINQLGKSGYGLWVLVGSFIGYYGLLNLGVSSAITRYIARFSARNNTKKLNETANTALLMFCITGLIAVLISFAIAGPLAVFFNITPEHIGEFKRIVAVLGIATGLSFPGGVFSAMITARERYVAVNIVNIAATLLRTALTVVILQAGHGLAGIAYPTLAATVASVIAMFFIVRSVVPEFCIRFDCARMSNLKMLLVYGGNTTIITVADILRLKIDSIVIGRMIGMAEVGIYGIAAILIGHMFSVVTAGMGVLTPRFAALDSEDKQEELKNTLLRALSISSCIACCLALLLILFGRPFVFLWVGKDFDNAVPVLTVLAISYAFALSQTPGISLMYAMNKHRYYAVVTTLEAIANVFLSILLSRHYGIIGVALGTAIPMLVVKLVVQPIYVSRLVGLRLSQYGRAIAPAIIVATLFFVGHRFLISLCEADAIGATSYFVLGVSGATVAVVYLALISTLSPPVLNVTRSILRAGGTFAKSLST